MPALAALCALACAAAAQAGQRGADPQRGAARVAACAACHGSGASAPLAGTPTLAAQQREFLVLQMFLMREGLREVPQMKGLLDGYTDADLADVAAYFSSQPRPARAAAANPRLLQRGASLSQAMGCGSCHLSDYQGQRQVPRLAGQREDFLALTMRAYRDDRRSGTDTSMNAAMYGVSDADIDALAHYLAHR